MSVEQYAAVVVAAAVVLDRLVAAGGVRRAPLARLVAAVRALDRTWSQPRPVRVLLVLCLPLAAGALAGGAVAVAAPVHAGAAVLVAGVALWAATSLRPTLAAARAAIAASDGDPEAAARGSGTLADSAAASSAPPDVRTAVVVGLARVAVRVVAPLAAFVVLAPTSLALAAAGAVWVAAVTALADAPDEAGDEAGIPAARATAVLATLLAWVPARVTAGLVALADGSPDALGRARQWADAAPSRTAGWPVATLAAAIGAKLERPGEDPINPIGTPPDRRQADRATVLVSRAATLASGIATVWLAASALGLVAWP